MEDVKIVESVRGMDKYSDELIIEFTDGTVFYMKHFQDCCENVSIEDVDGDVSDLIGGEWLGVDERTKDNNMGDDDWDGIGMWTFYTISTSKGTVWIRWYGSSNGYYSVGVSHGYASSVEEVSHW